MSRVEKLCLCPRVTTLQIQFRKNWHRSIDPSYKGLLWFWLASHGPLGKQLSFRLELLCTIEYDTLTAKMAPILHPFVIPCPLQALPIPLNLGCPCGMLQPREHTKDKHLPVPSLCLYRLWVPPFALLDLASPGKQSWISPGEDERSHGAKPRLPQTSSPRHLASWPQALSAPSWAQPSSTRIITATSLPADAWAKRNVY